MELTEEHMIEMFKRFFVDSVNGREKAIDLLMDETPEKLPLKLPEWTGMRDPNDQNPVKMNCNLAGGIFFLGNDIENYELWLKDTDMKTHMLVYGSTGSGKTAALQSMGANAMLLDTGLCYIDPKGNPNIANEIFTMARRVNREDDVLILDFMTGGKKTEIQTPFRMSNTINPFAKAPADAITNLMTSLLPRDKGGGNSVFRQKATALLTALIPVLVALRDAGLSFPLTDMSEKTRMPQGSLGKGLNIRIIRDYLNDPEKCVSLVYPVKEHISENKSDQSVNIFGVSSGKKTIDMNNALKIIRHDAFHEDKEPCCIDYGNMEECDIVKRFVDPEILDVLKAALSSLNYDPDKGPVREQQAYLDQFGYARAYFGSILSSISGMYGHLFNVSRGEIDMGDVLFNRRIMIGILPSLEKNPTECENLGKIILASVKNSISGTLGDKLEGATREIMAARPSASKVPGIIVVDEYANIMMPGFEVILTQARSQGLMAIIASQDYSGMKGRDQKSCDQILENTAIKIFMKMDSDSETWNLIRKLFGHSMVENGEDKETKICLHDIMDQREGAFHAFHANKMIYGAFPYMIPKILPKDHMRINRFVEMDTDRDVIERNLEGWIEKGKAAMA